MVTSPAEEELKRKNEQHRIAIGQFAFQGYCAVVDGTTTAPWCLIHGPATTQSLTGRPAPGRSRRWSPTATSRGIASGDARFYEITNGSLEQGKGTEEAGPEGAGDSHRAASARGEAAA